jgi:hypothetical protein
LKGLNPLFFLAHTGKESISMILRVPHFRDRKKLPPVRQSPSFISPVRLTYGFRRAKFAMTFWAQNRAVASTLLRASL